MKYNLINKLPPELHRYIYMYLNPISIPNKLKPGQFWCNNCGEILVNGDWFMSFGSEESYLLYECDNCNYSNIFYNYELIDKIIINEIN